MIGAIAALLLCQLIGEVAVAALGLPVPGPVLGMVLMFCALAIRRDVPEPLEATAEGMLRHLLLLFVPAGVGILLHVARIKTEWTAILIALLVSTWATIAVTALVFRWAAGTADTPEDEDVPS